MRGDEHAPARMPCEIRDLKSQIENLTAPQIRGGAAVSVFAMTARLGAPLCPAWRALAASEDAPALPPKVVFLRIKRGPHPVDRLLPVRQLQCDAQRHVRVGALVEECQV